MVNGVNFDINLQWMRDYHNPTTEITGTPSGADMKGNCTRCGQELPTHEDQDAHNMQVHLNK